MSNYLKETEGLKGVEGITVYNALSSQFRQTADQFRNLHPIQHSPFSILMLCSLKGYKGVDAFITIAEKLPAYHFNLVLNATRAEIHYYFKGVAIPKNVVIYPKQQKVHQFYQAANLVLNLSKPTEWVETFGMTLLEAMHYGLPVIAPPVGGPAEVVQHGQNGYLISSEDIPAIISKIEELARDREIYYSFSKAALILADTFSEANFRVGLMSLMEEETRRSKRVSVKNYAS